MVARRFKTVSKKNIKVKVKKGDEVIVIAGKDKGKRGNVSRVKLLPAGKTKVLIEGINIVKKHVRPNPQAGKPGGVVEQESWVDVSNIQLFDATTKKGGKVGYRFLEDGRKVRYFKSSNEIVDIDKG